MGRRHPALPTYMLTMVVLARRPVSILLSAIAPHDSASRSSASMGTARTTERYRSVRPDVGAGPPPPRSPNSLRILGTPRAASGTRSSIVLDFTIEPAGIRFALGRAT